MRFAFILLLALFTLVACDLGNTAADATLSIRAVAGPTCPVETDPPDPDCAPRPVAGAQILVQPADGRDIAIAQAETNADGLLVLKVPAGDYLVIGGAVEGLMGGAEPVTVSAGAGTTVEVDLAYDTGIR